MSRHRASARTGYEFHEPPAPGSVEFARLVEGLTGAALRSGNRVRILRDGRQTFPAMLDAIASARTAIDVSSYIYGPSDVAHQLTKALCEKAQAGVEVNVVLDGGGSAELDQATVPTLEDAGATVRFFGPSHWYALTRLSIRMHRLLLIVDGRVGFAGGIGIGDVWTGNTEDPEHWRETHAMVEGPAVRDILGGFQEDWAEAARVVLGPAHLPELAGFDDGIDVHVIRGPARPGSAASQLFYAAIAGARERLWITTTHFVPGEAFADILCESASRGVDVRILVNGTNVDRAVVHETGQRRYGRLLEAGVRIFEYQPALLHSKVMIADGWANLGASDFEHRCLGLDDELIVAFDDLDTVDELAQHFHDDIDASEELELAIWRMRPLAKRAREVAGDLFRQSF